MKINNEHNTHITLYQLLKNDAVGIIKLNNLIMTKYFFSGCNL